MHKKAALHTWTVTALGVTLMCGVVGASGFAQVESRKIPSQYFGMHTLQPAKHWPSIPVGGMRPANVAWGAINTSRGAYNWALLDEWVNAVSANGVELNYLFLRTPQWASSRPSESCYAGNIGCAAPPADLNDWDTFVKAMVTRYKGRIHSYELWNEPNDPAYWTGSTAELVELARRAYAIIKAIDPAAKVLTPSPTWKSVTAWQWLDGYFAAGGQQYSDVVAYHGYTGTTRAESVLTIISNVKKVMKARGVNQPMWVTEGGWGLNSVISDHDQQAAFLAQRYLLTWSAGVERNYWYQWDNQNWGTLWDSTNGIRKAGVALGEVYGWLAGATMASPCTQSSDSTWRCGLTREDGYEGLVVWNPSASLSLSVDSRFAQYRDLAGKVTALSGIAPVGNKPILLETAAGAEQPKAVLKVSPLSGEAPLTVTADSSESTPADAFVSRSLDFGDGTVVEGAVSASHSYGAAGNYTVRARLQDAAGNDYEATQAVSVVEASPPEAKLIVKVNRKESLSITADSSASSDLDGSIVSRTIHFGDGTSVSNVLSAKHKYAAPGSYVVSVKVTDDDGLSDEATQVVNVTDLQLKIRPVSAKVKRGSSSSYTVSLEPQSSSFEEDVTLSCSGLPAGYTCSFSQNVVSVNGVSAESVLTVSAPATAGLPPPPGWLRLEGGLAAFALVWPAGFALASKRRRRRVCEMLLLIAAVALLHAGCGGSSASVTQKSAQAGPVTYTLTVTAVSASVERSLTAQLTVE